MKFLKRSDHGELKDMKELLAKVFFCHLWTHPPLSPGRSAPAEPGRVPLQGGEHNLLSLNSFPPEADLPLAERSPPPGGVADLSTEAASRRRKAGVGSGHTFATDSKKNTFSIDS